MLGLRSWRFQAEIDVEKDSDEMMLVKSFFTSVANCRIHRHCCPDSTALIYSLYLLDTLDIVLTTANIPVHLELLRRFSNDMKTIF